MSRLNEAHKANKRSVNLFSFPTNPSDLYLNFIKNKVNVFIQMTLSSRKIMLNSTNYSWQIVFILAANIHRNHSYIYIIYHHSVIKRALYP